MPLDNEDKLYLAGLARAIVRAIATGSFAIALRHGAGEGGYTKAEHDLAEVLTAIGDTQASSGLTEEGAVEAAKKAAREGTG